MLQMLARPRAHRPVQFLPPPPREAAPQGGGAPGAEAAPPLYLVEPDRNLRIQLGRTLFAAGFDTRPFADMHDFLAALPDLACGCVILGVGFVAEAAALCRSAGEETFPLPTILASTSLAREDAIAALRLGAADLLERPPSPDDLVAAVRRAAGRVAACELRLAARRARAAVDVLPLRQREVLGSMMTGMSNKEIARGLGISPRTVEMHRARLQRKLGVASLAELLALAWRAAAAGPA